MDLETRLRELVEGIDLDTQEGREEAEELIRKLQELLQDR